MKGIIYGLVALCSLPILNNHFNRYSFDGKINGESVIYTPFLLGDELKVTDKSGDGVLYGLDPFTGGCVKKCDLREDDLSNCLYYSDHEKDDSKAIFDNADTYVRNLKDRILTQKELMGRRINSPQ